MDAVERRMTTSLSGADLAVLRGWLTDCARNLTPGPDITQEKASVTRTRLHPVGTGAPLVLLHGIGSSRHAWDPVVPALSERFGVIAVDLPASSAAQAAATGGGAAAKPPWRPPSRASSTISASPPPRGGQLARRLGGARAG